MILLLLACARAAPDPAPVVAPVEIAKEEPARRTDAYPWRDPKAPYEPLSARVAPPAGYIRPPLTGYAAWLRDLPLLPVGSPVLSYSGGLIRSGDDPDLLAVVDLDLIPGDLQQCADTVIRLYAEWAWHEGDKSIGFHFTSGDLSSWSRWAEGYRPVIAGSHVSWTRSARPDDSRDDYKLWLKSVMTYAGTLSLAREGHPVPVEQVLPGDFLSLGGSPGHALVVLDVASDASGQTAVLIGEGYMPAQSLHLLRGPLEGWWPTSAPLQVPTWPTPFPWSSLRRFGEG